jgi:hypothetical protein
MTSRILILFMALFPLSTFAGNGDKQKNKKIDIHITLDKKGQVKITGLNGDLKELQDEINKTLEDVTIKLDDGKKKHDIHIKAELKTK